MTEFKKLVYIPTLLRGYKMDLQNMEYRNSFYLNKINAFSAWKRSSGS
jgi:hypothetical protein